MDITAYILFSIAQALAASGVSPAGELPSTAVASVDDLGGPPSAPPPAVRHQAWTVGDVASAALILAGTFAGGLAAGISLHGKRKGVGA